MPRWPTPSAAARSSEFFVAVPGVRCSGRSTVTRQRSTVLRSLRLERWTCFFKILSPSGRKTIKLLIKLMLSGQVGTSQLMSNAAYDERRASPLERCLPSTACVFASG